MATVQPEIDDFKLKLTSHQIFRMKISARDEILESLQNTMKNRKGLSTEVWIDNERNSVRNAANHFRRRHFLPDISENDLLKAERLAMGHSDYSEKFALYAAEIVVGQF